MSANDLNRADDAGGYLPDEVKPAYSDDLVTVYNGDCLDVLRTLPDHSVDAVVTDPPYGLGFMGKAWDSPGGTGDFPMRRFDAINTVNTGASRQGGRQRSCEDFTRRQARDARSYQSWCQSWAEECLRVLKPGGHLLAFGGTRTAHRLACAIEDAGFELRDSIAWLYGSGFPKSLDVSKAIDKAARGVPQGAADPTSPNHGRYRTTKTEGKRWDGDSGQGYGAGGSRFLSSGGVPAESGPAAIAPEAEAWSGWGTALKPANEPIVVARKSPVGSVAANVLTHGTGALNIDGCRIEASGRPLRISHGEDTPGKATYGSNGPGGGSEAAGTTDAGRWPTNVVLDEAAAAALDGQTGTLTSGLMRAGITPKGERNTYGQDAAEGYVRAADTYGDSGGASRFFPIFRYEAKAPQQERPSVDGVMHPTVKPLDLMRWLVRLVTPPGGLVLEPFAGSGTTAEACIVEGFRCIAVEREADYLPLILARITKPIEPVLFSDGAA